MCGAIAPRGVAASRSRKRRLSGGGLAGEPALGRERQRGAGAGARRRRLGARRTGGATRPAARAARMRSRLDVRSRVRAGARISARAPAGRRGAGGGAAERQRVARCAVLGDGRRAEPRAGRRRERTARCRAASGPTRRATARSRGVGGSRGAGVLAHARPRGGGTPPLMTTRASPARARARRPRARLLQPPERQRARRRVGARRGISARARRPSTAARRGAARSVAAARRSTGRLMLPRGASPWRRRPRARVPAAASHDGHRGLRRPIASAAAARSPPTGWRRRTRQLRVPSICSWCAAHAENGCAPARRRASGRPRPRRNGGRRRGGSRRVRRRLSPRRGAAPPPARRSATRRPPAVALDAASSPRRGW